MSLQIIEILGRSEQGVTKPFICRAENNEIYFVKGRGAGRRSLLCEWIASSMAQRFGLPVAPFEIVEVPQELVEIATRDDIGDLGAGPAFGSRRMQITELTVSNVFEIPLEVQMDVLAFDWWIRNGDRNLSDQGGNPNLFWDVVEEGLVVLDHNQAFDDDFSAENFVELHVFRNVRDAISRDLFTRVQLEDRFEQILVDFDSICDTSPPEWWFLDAEQTIPVNFSRHQIKLALEARRGNEFWSFT
ncbi:hypothetical protein GCM10027277_17820 [Pseudoduganella ginsengisoli]|uniref:HipA-like kinase domain-containing protein n=1 Tax=Pseudoduganella ginsengisoli TaxID=1462440 RepID=A0A6L6PUP8_9BURK|nr:HipA family kinase [Pseudoduganella ginsengisoli]MTW00961.1 hypothetical protein [Pseudoduganella ginsengisoli]